MGLLNINNENEILEYNKFIKNSEYGNFMQDLAWAKVKKNWKYEIVVLRNNKKIYASMLILIHKLPITNYSILYVPRGPVCNIYDINTINLLVNETKKVQEKYNAFVLKFDPKIKYSKFIEKIFKENGYIFNRKNCIQPKYNMIINIENKSKEDVLSDVSSKCRYNINYAYKNNVKVTYSDSKSYLDIFYNLYTITTIRDKIDCRPYSYFEDIINNFSTTEVRIYLAKHENDFLSGAICLNYAGEIVYLYGASASIKRNLKASYALQSEMIKWGIDSNCKTYNLGGLLKPDLSNGLYQFKIGFTNICGVKEYLGEIDKVYNNGIYYLYKMLLPVIRIKNNLLNGFNTK